MSNSRLGSFAVLVAMAAGLACRDAASNPTRPSFGIVNDTLPGGCDRNVCNFNAFGDAAFASWSDVGTTVASDTGGGGGGGTTRFGNVSVSRGGSTGNQETFVSYNVVECGPNFCTSIAGGFGRIPNADFSAGGSTYRLATNTVGNPDFFTFVGPAGQITVEWVANGLFKQRFNGSSSTSSPGFTEHSAGQSTFSSAGTAGSVVGFAITAGSLGQVSGDHQVRITISR